jgi:hypothetical protein
MMKIHGLDEIVKQLENLQRSAEELNGTHTVPLSEVLTPEFLTRCSGKGTLDEILGAAGLSCSSQEDFEAIAPAALDAAVAKGTSFGSWQEMLDQATQEWALRQLKF